MKRKYTVNGMSCARCSAAVERAALSVQGVQTANANLSGKYLICEYETPATDEKILKAIKKAGYKPSLDKDEKQNDSTVLQLAVSCLFTVLLMYVCMGHMVGLPLPSVVCHQYNFANNAALQLVLAFFVLVINYRIFFKGISGVLHGASNMDTLVSLGCLASFVYSAVCTVLMLFFEYNAVAVYFDSSAMILTFVLLGRTLEGRSKKRTNSALASLYELKPTKANVLRDGVECSVSSDDVKLGETVIVRPGENIPVDGVIINGQTETDESAMTGESLSISKKTGDEVCASTLNISGAIHVKATKIGADTAFSKIIALVESAAASKAPIARMADKAAEIFVPCVVCISILTFIIWMIIGGINEALTHSVAVLVISCPCALGLATPLAITVSVGACAKSGILIKSASVLEILHKCDTVCLDKTGTVTKGMPCVTDVLCADGVSEERMMTVAVSVEKFSTHPISGAIVRYKNIPSVEDIHSFENIPGRGVRAEINGASVIGGSRALMQENNIDISAFEHIVSDFEKMGKTAVFFAENGKLLGVVACADEVRESSEAAIRSMRNKGISVYILTGDGAGAGNAVANAVGADGVYCSMMPDDKQSVIKQLQSKGKTVLMVGDGINDSPALTVADVGVAIGAGTDAAINGSDVVLARNDIWDVLNALDISQKTYRIIKQNLFWALFYNVICIPVAAGALTFLGFTLSPAIASVAMSISSIFVVTNSLRLKGIATK